MVLKQPMTYSDDFRRSCLAQVAALVGEQVSSTSFARLYEIIATVASRNPPLSGSTLRRWIEYQHSGKQSGVDREERKRKRDVARESERTLKGDLYTHEHISYVKDLLSESPGLRDQELMICVYLTYGVFFPPHKIHDEIHRQNWTIKVMAHFAREMNEELVGTWRRLVQGLDATMFVYGDGKHLNSEDCERKKGRAPRGVKAVQTKKIETLDGGAKQSGCCALFTLSIEGPMSVSTQEISNIETMNYALEIDVLPLMNPFPGVRSVLVLDNCPNYDKIWLVALFASRGVKIVFQPTYAPRVNPTEPCHNIMQKYIQERYGSYCKPFDRLFQEAYWTSITTDIALEQFRNCGHIITEGNVLWAKR
jgi:hypothetical protein